MLTINGFLHFGVLRAEAGGAIIATVAVTENHLATVYNNVELDNQRKEWILRGMMEQGMLYNPVLKLFTSWEEMPETMRFSDVIALPTVVL